MTSSGRLSVERVSTRAQFTEFTQATWRERDRAVPLLEPTLRSWWRGTSPHASPIDLVLVRNAAGRVVGRTTTHRDPALEAKLGTGLQLFGATEAASPAALRAVLNAVGESAREAGLPEVLGPVSLLPNQSGGVITSGFEHRGFVDSAWNPPWVPAVYEQFGLSRWNESDTWTVPVTPFQPPPPSSWSQQGVELEYGSRRTLPQVIPALREVLNASFAQLPYYTEISPEQMATATESLGWLLDPRLFLIARAHPRRHSPTAATPSPIVAFALVIPDVTSYVQRTRGSMGLMAQLGLLARRSRLRSEAILVIQGTDPAWQGRGLMSLISQQLQANLHEGGYHTLRSTYVGRDNPGSARQFSRYGGTPLHGYTFYRGTLAAIAAATRTKGQR